MIEKRSPLTQTAERAGWVGCNIILSTLPPDARIDVVRDGIATSPKGVRDIWSAFSFLRDATPESRGWISDVLACVREIRMSEFTLNDVYSFERRLGDMHKGNRNLRAKIRQQLQVLRDRGVLEFVGVGRYRVLSESPTE
jgi:type II restriction enzyme